MEIERKEWPSGVRETTFDLKHQLKLEKEILIFKTLKQIFSVICGNRAKRMAEMRLEDQNRPKSSLETKIKFDFQNFEIDFLRCLMN